MIPNSDKYYLKLLYYKIDLTNYIYTKINEQIDDDFVSSKSISYDFRNKGLSCEYMTDYQGYGHNYLICFFIIDYYIFLNHDDELAESFYIIDEEKIEWTKYSNLKYIDSSDIENTKQIKTVANSDSSKVLIALLLSTNKINYYKFHYREDNPDFYDSYTGIFGCRDELYSMKLNYLVNNNHAVLSCINSDSIVQASIFPDNLDNPVIKNQFESCQSIYGHNVLYSEYHSKYYVISDVKCGEYIRSFEPLEGELSEIIEIDSTQIKQNKDTAIITELLTEKSTDHNEKEKEKEKEEKEQKKNKEEEKEEDNSIKEKEENDKEKEVEMEKEKEIQQGIEKNKEREIITETIKQIPNIEITNIKETIFYSFNCSQLEKCSLCNEESLSKNLCIKCNNELGYYYLNKHPSSFLRNNYIDCVTENTKPKNYYFNIGRKDFEPCYLSCATCDYLGNNRINNCTQCDEEIFTKNREE